MINLDASIYGTFAEIGAGQEVVRNFFTAGGASGTIAKSISAYDMVFSDIIYGKEENGRYVCRSRLVKMLDKEFSLLQERLSSVRAEDTRFFAFADTVAAKQYKKDNESHGWLGVRFQHQKKAEASQVMLHVRLLDQQNLLQQRVLGILGTNLLHACFFRTENAHDFVHAIMEELDNSQVEIDVIHFEGPVFKKYDNRLMNLYLVKQGLTDAVMFSKEGQVVLASEVLYKKSLLVLRGSFRPPTLASVDMLKSGKEEFLKDNKIKEDDLVTLAEIAMSKTSKEEIADEDLLARITLLCDLEQNVLITNYSEYFRLSSYFARFTPSPVGIILGVYNYKQIFEESYYQDIAGGLLESLGRLFRSQVKIYIYPYKEDDGQYTTAQNIVIPEKYKEISQYLKNNHYVHDIKNFDARYLGIYSRKVLTLMQKGDKTWEAMVPPVLIEKIKKNSATFS